MAGKSTSERLDEITSEWYLDYCIHQLWKEFKEKCTFSEFWKDDVQDYLMNKKFNIGQELSNKVQCIRFIIGLLESQQVDDCASQGSSGDEQSSEDENETRFLGCDCLSLFDKIAKIYPFSDVEKSHMRSALKLQIVLSHYRHGDINQAKSLFLKLYNNDNGDNEEYQDDVRELLQIKDHTQKEAFLTKHTYDKFLKQVQQFFTPVWKKFGTPVLEEAPFMEDSSITRIDAKTIKALYFAWDQSEEAEQNWSSIVEGTHPDIKGFKNKTKSRDTQDTSGHSTEKRPSTRQLQQDIRSCGETSSPQKTSMSVKIQRCDEVLKNLKASSSNLFSGLKDPYSDMVAGEAGPSRINKNSNDNEVDDDGDDDYNDDDNLTFKRRCKPVVAIPDSPSGKKVDKKGKGPLERRSTKRRYNEEHSDAEIIDWDSDDETEINHKAIKLLSPPRERCLNIQLPKTKARKFWSDEETNWLKQGVKAYGEGNWSQILKAYNFTGRTSVHLKDRWRNLQKKYY